MLQSFDELFSHDPDLSLSLSLCYRAQFARTLARATDPLVLPT